MQIYMVGGAVRDKLLNLPVMDRDWVVVGATPQQLLDQGYRQVGKDFPVFLHPDTNEEYALARTERKTAPGYTGFAVDTSATVTLEQDLQRRDLTINAIAESAQGEIIDPYGGVEDLRRRLLRHVSPAFSEDPLRILRVARFAARFHELGFRVAPETMALMREMVSAGEVDALVPERVWVETVRALGESQPAQYFEVLRACGALKILLPELDGLFGIPQTQDHHPEIDSGVHSLMALQRACELSQDTRVRFATLLHDVGKVTTPASLLPHHFSHEKHSVDIIKQICRRLAVPNEFRDLAILVARYHSHCHRADELKSTTLLKTLEALDAFRRPDRLEQFLLACEADATGRLGYEDAVYEQADIFRQAFAAARAVDARSLAESGLQGRVLAGRLHDLRASAIAEQKFRRR